LAHDDTKDKAFPEETFTVTQGHNSLQKNDDTKDKAFPGEMSADNQILPIAATACDAYF
jgi:hypothetical protein